MYFQNTLKEEKSNIFTLYDKMGLVTCFKIKICLTIIQNVPTYNLHVIIL